MHWKVLSKKQTELLKKLKFLKREGFYLAGGTALALQIGHRTSLDFDFYTPKKFSPQKLREKFEEEFKEVKEIYLNQDTLILDVENLKISFFRYPYPLLKPLQEKKGILFASVEDIAAMKVLAISQRGLMRDFIDVYFLIKKFGLKKILEFAKKKYPSFNIYLALQALSYFKDAEEDLEKKRYKLFKKVSFSEVKKFILEKLAEFKKQNL